MSDNNKCSAGLLNASQDTVALAFELAGGTLDKSPATIRKILEDPAVWKEIEKTLQAEGKKLANQQLAGKPVTQSDALQMGKAVALSAGKAAQKSAESQIKKSTEYTRLQAQLKQLECSYKKSPIGVFVDENKAWLIVVAAGVVAGGATALYVIKDGDFVAEKATLLANSALRFKVLGKLEVGGKDIKFKPSERQVAATAFANVKFEKISAKFEGSVAFKEDKLVAAGGRGEVVAKVAKGLTAKAYAGAGYQQPGQAYQPSLRYDVGLGLDYKPGSGISVTALAFAMQDPTQRKVGGSGSVNLRVVGKKATDPSLSINATGAGNQYQRFGPTGPQSGSEFQFKLGLTANF